MLAERHRPQALDVASGMNIAAFNAGVVAGSSIGAMTIHAWGLSVLAPVGSAIVGSAIIAFVWQSVLPSMKAISPDQKVTCGADA